MNRRTVLIVGLLLLLALGGGWWFGRASAPGSANVEASGPGAHTAASAASAEDEYLSGAVTLALRGDGQIRDFPSLSGGAVLREQAAGTSVTGRWVRGAEPNSRWLRLAGGGYLHESAIAERSAQQAGNAAQPAAGPPIRINISNQGCDWGPDVQPYFDRSIAAREALAARSPGGVAPEDSSSFVSVPNRPWRGLTVTAIAIHWESSSVYFREPVDVVRRVLRANGIEVSDLGEMPIRNEEAVEAQSLDPTNAEDRRWGAAGITCGV
jgi:hypothetical protein